MFGKPAVIVNHFGTKGNNNFSSENTGCGYDTFLFYLSGWSFKRRHDILYLQINVRFVKREDIPFYIVKGDVTRMGTDAVVNAANRFLAPEGGIDGNIRRRAGYTGTEETEKIGGCPTGKACITGAGDLDAKYIIHAVGPIREGGHSGEAELSASCYREALRSAVEAGCKTVAFPLLSSGIYGYPKPEAMRIVVEAIRDFLLHEDDLEIFPVIFGWGHYFTKKYLTEERYQELEDIVASVTESEPEDLSGSMESGFPESLLQLMDERGLSDVECCRKANVSRELFSEIRSDVDYRPEKTIVPAFAVALSLSVEETEKLLERAGFAFSSERKFDVIVRYLISEGVHDVFLINIILFVFGQPLPGQEIGKDQKTEEGCQGMR